MDIPKKKKDKNKLISNSFKKEVMVTSSEMMPILEPFFDFRATDMPCKYIQQNEKLNGNDD